MLEGSILLVFSFKKMGNSAIKKELNKEDLEMLHKLSKKPIDEIEFWYEHFIKGAELSLNYF